MVFVYEEEHDSVFLYGSCLDFTGSLNVVFVKPKTECHLIGGILVLEDTNVVCVCVYIVMTLVQC